MSVLTARSRNVWIGFSSGLARYHQGSFTFFTAKDGLPPGGIQSAYLDHASRLWLGSLRGGLVRVDDPSAERPLFTTYTTAQGLSSNSAGVIVSVTSSQDIGKARADAERLAGSPG